MTSHSPAIVNPSNSFSTARPSSSENTGSLSLSLLPSAKYACNNTVPFFFFKEQGLCLLAAISKVRLQHNIDLLMGRVSVSLLAANSKVHLQQHSTDLLMSRVSVSLFAAVSKECPQEQSKMYATSTEQNH